MKNENTIMELNIRKNIIGKLSELFVNRFELAVLLMGLITILGVTSYFLLPKESLPEIVFPTLTIQTVYPGAGTVDVEKLVTEPIESKLSGLDQVTDINSVSNEGFSFVTVSFEEGVDIDRKKVELEGLLGELNLPEAALKPTTSTFKTSEIPLISLSLAGDYTLYQLTDYANLLQKEIEKIPGVETVSVFGNTEREIQIVLNQSKANKVGITMDTIVNTIKGKNVSAPLGNIEAGGDVYNLRIDEQIQSIEVLKSLEITTNRGNTVYLRDIATISDTNKSLTQFNRSFTQESGINNSVFLSVVRQNKSDVLGTSEKIKEQVAQAIGTSIPADLNVVFTRDTAVQVKEDIDSIQSNALSGLLVVILVLFLFIGFRESLVVAVTIPLTLLSTLGILSLFGITLNTFAILGLIVSLGLLVDNSIIVMENMDRLRKKGISAKLAAVFGTNQVGFPVLSATLTTVAAFLPLAILPGIIGAFINTIPRTIIISLTASLLIAVVITPSVYAVIFSRMSDKKAPSPFVVLVGKLLKVVFVGILSAIAFYGKNVWIGIPIIATILFVLAIIGKEFLSKGKELEDNKLVKGYSQWLLKIVASPLRIGLLMLISVAVLVSSSLLITSGSLKIAFFPETQPTSVGLTLDTPPGTSLEETSAITSEVEELLMSSPDVAQFNTTIGGNEADLSTIRIDLVQNDANGFDQLENIKQLLANVTAAKITFESQGAGGPPVGNPIEIKIIGDDLASNKVYVEQLAEKLKAVEGTYNVESSLKNGGQQLLFNINQVKAQELGLSNGYIAFAIRNQLSGQIATTLKDADETIDVRVLSNVVNLEDLKEAVITSPMGKTIVLNELVTIEQSTGVAGISRTDGKRVITLTSDLTKGYNATDALEIFKQSIVGLDVPEGTVVSYGGEAAGISENFTNLFQSMLLAMFLVFIILTVQFGSIKQPLIILTTIPMAFIGVLYGLKITGNEFGFYAFMALISLVGIAVNDAIVLIDYMNYLRKEGYSFYEAITEATRTRFSPVFATTLTTIGGILPLAFRSAYYAQFAYALVFGLLVTTFMTLVLIPSLYALFEGKATRKSLKEESRVIKKLEQVYQE